MRALLDGSMTMMREEMELPTKGEYVRPDMGGWAPTTYGGGGCFTIGRGGERIPAPEGVAIWNQTTGTCIAAPLQVGDRLWVREAWQTAMSDNGPCVLYRANSERWYPKFTGPDEGAGPSYDYERYPGDYSCWASDVEARGPWRSSVHMPRWASRLTLIVESVKIEHLQNISEPDARAEGVYYVAPTVEDLEWYRGHCGETGADPNEPMDGVWMATGTRRGYGLSKDERNREHWGPTAQFAFRMIWEELNGREGKHSWAANPWVAAVSFRVVKANIDSLERESAACSA